MFGLKLVKASSIATSELPLSGRIDKLEADIRVIRLEWEDVYEKIITVLGRINKRHARANPGIPLSELDERGNNGPLTMEQLVDLARKKGVY